MRFLMMAICFLLASTLLLQGQSITQLGLIIDASSSTEDELPTFRNGIAEALRTLKTDGSLELTLTQFSAEGLVIFGPSKIDSPAILQEAVNTVLALDPTETDVPPFNGGTNLEDAFLETLTALQGSPNANDASLQFVNMLTDGHPTSHNHLGLQDFDELSRHQRGQMFAKDQRDALIAAGIDVISFEALGSSAEDTEYLKTLAYPEPAFIVQGNPLKFPDSITTQGFLLPIATENGIAAALTAKFAAAGFGTSRPPDPLQSVESIERMPSGAIRLVWPGIAGARFQVEWSLDLVTWVNNLPNSILNSTTTGEKLTYEDANPMSNTGYYRVAKLAD